MELENKIDNFVGNQKIVTFFNLCFKNGFPAQSFGLFGVEHLGKMFLVEQIVKILGCKIGVSYFPVTKEEGKTKISIEQVKNWKKMLKYSANGNNKIIGVIEQGEYLNEESGNLLLKVIEEPEANVLIFIIANNRNDLPRTIMSRLLPLYFSKVTKEELFLYFKNKDFEESRILNSIELANNLPGLTHSLLTNNELFNEFQERDIQASKLFEYTQAERLLWLNNFFNQNEIDRDEVLLWLKKIAQITCLRQNNIINPVLLSWLAEYSNFIKVNSNQRLFFEKIILSL